MSDKEKEIIKRSIEIDEYTPICYRRDERPEYMWEDACIMSNCTRLLRSEKDDQKLIRHIRKNGISQTRSSTTSKKGAKKTKNAHPYT